MTTQHTYQSKFAGQEIGYLQYLPETEEKAPVILFLHGLGYRSTAKNGAIWWKRLKDSCWFINSGKEWPFAVIVPQQPAYIASKPGTVRTAWDVDIISEVIGCILANDRLDDNRIYLIGESMGGGGVWNALAKLHEYIAAAAPICGTNPIGYSEIKVAKDVPVWAFHNTGDNVVPVKHTQNYVEQLRQVNNQVKATYFRWDNHHAWNFVYGIQQASVTEDSDTYTVPIWEWLLQYRKRENVVEPEPGVATPEPVPIPEKVIHTYTEGGKQFEVVIREKK